MRIQKKKEDNRTAKKTKNKKRAKEKSKQVKLPSYSIQTKFIHEIAFH
jgi:hypothetical protein